MQDAPGLESETQLTTLKDLIVVFFGVETTRLRSSQI